MRRLEFSTLKAYRVLHDCLFPIERLEYTQPEEKKSPFKSYIIGIDPLPKNKTWKEIISQSANINLKPKKMNRKAEIIKLQKQVNELESRLISKEYHIGLIKNQIETRMNNHKADNERENKETINCLVAITDRIERLIDHLGLEEKTIPSTPEKVVLTKKKGK